MNKADWSFNGGIPFEADDLEFTQDAAIEMFQGIARFLIEDDPVTEIGSYILCGLRPTDVGGTDTNFEEGFVAINGELYFVPTVQHTNLGGPGERWVARVSETNPVAGDETLEDGSNVSTYKQRQAPIIKLPAASIDPLTDLEITVFISTNVAQPRWYDEITKKQTFRDTLATEYIDNDMPIKTDADITNLDAKLTVTFMKFHKDPFGNVHLRAKFTGSAALTDGATMFTLPTGYRPAELHAPFMMRFDGPGSTFDNVFFEIDASGNCVYRLPDNTNANSTLNETVLLVASYTIL